MDTRHLVDPQLLPFLETMPLEDVDERTLAARRTRADVLIAGQTPDNLPVAVTEHYVPGPSGAPRIRLLIVQPNDNACDRPALLHFHGGGLVMGKPEVHLPYLRPMAAELGAVVVSVDYRLAPEAPFPAAIEDGFAALCWLKGESRLLGIDVKRIGVIGESAGGNLAAGLCLLTRDRQGPTIAFQNLIYPMLDDRVDATTNPVVGQFAWTRASNRFAWRAYLGQVASEEGVSPYAAPARARDFSRLPPLYLATGALDLFLDENLHFVQALAAAGVSVEADVYPGAFHAFDVAPDAEVAQRARSRRMDALERAVRSLKAGS